MRAGAILVAVLLLVTPTLLRLLLHMLSVRRIVSHLAKNYLRCALHLVQAIASF